VTDVSIRERPVVVAGHVCLDIIPSLDGAATIGPDWFAPGKLAPVGPATVATGGAVANTGIALHRLGNPVRLMGKIGTDLFGKMILDIISGNGIHPTDSMIIGPGEHTSYTIVISPPNIDRMFLHCTGANDTFRAADLRDEQLRDAAWFHFGYPPLMKSVYEADGRELQSVLRAAKRHGLPTSLDMARPDPASPAGQADWRLILEQTLPLVDVFMPSLEEIAEMLRIPGDIAARLQAEGSAALDEIAEQLLAMGCAIVVLKLGEHGLYVRSTSDRVRIDGMHAPNMPDMRQWLNRQLYAPCYEVDTKGTTGAGDCTIAGFIAGMLHGLSPEQTLRSAVGVGASCVEQPDATSGIPHWSDLQARMSNGWLYRVPSFPLPGWKQQTDTPVWLGILDQDID